jgi:hypothetical protein
MRSIADETRQAFIKHLLECPTGEMEKTRSIIQLIDRVYKMLDDMMANGNQAQFQLELKAIEEGRHKIYGVG